jgi:hypothetical protein
MKFYGNGYSDSMVESDVWATLDGRYWIQILRENLTYELFNEGKLLGTFRTLKTAKTFAVNHEVKRMNTQYVAERKSRNA